MCLFPGLRRPRRFEVGGLGCGDWVESGFIAGVPMQRPRFQVRTLMLAVAVVAVLVWGVLMGTRLYRDYTLAQSWAKAHSPDPPPSDFPPP